MTSTSNHYENKTIPRSVPIIPFLYLRRRRSHLPEYERYHPVRTAAGGLLDSGELSCRSRHRLEHESVLFNKKPFLFDLTSVISKSAFPSQNRRALASPTSISSTDVQGSMKRQKNSRRISKAYAIHCGETEPHPSSSETRPPGGRRSSRLWPAQPVLLPRPGRGRRRALCLGPAYVFT